MLASSFVRFASGLTITKAAVTQIKTLIKGSHENGIIKLDILENPFNGFAYDFGFLPVPRPGDVVFENDGARIALSKKTAMFLDGATLDHVSNPFGETFHVVLP